MPIVVIDTNILMADYSLQGAGLRTLFEGSNRCNIPVIVPEVVFDELVGNYTRRVHQEIEVFSKSKSILSRLLVNIDTPDVNLDDTFRAYRAGARTVFRIHGVKIADYPDVSPKDIVVASYQGGKPFKANGEGHKDFLIFRTILSVINEARDSVWFLTNNPKDFCSEGDKLHPELQAQLPDGREVTIFHSAKDFNNTHIIPQLERLDQIATTILAGEFAGFDIETSAWDCLYEQLKNRSLSYEIVQHLPYGFNDGPTVTDIHEHEVDDVSVNRLSDGVLVIKLNGGVSVEATGFIEKSDWYSMPAYESSSFSIIEADVNDWVMMASGLLYFQFEMSVVFNENDLTVDAVTVDLLGAESR